MSKLETNIIAPSTGTTITIGESGDTVALGSGATQTGFGGTNTPTFKAYGTTQSIPNNTTTVLAYTTESWDTNSNYDNSTYRFTPNVAGKYFVYAVIRLESGSPYNHLELIIRKNNVDFLNALNSPKYYDSLSACGLIDMNGTTDYIDFAIYQDSGGSLNTKSTINYNQAGAYKIIE